MTEVLTNVPYAMIRENIRRIKEFGVGIEIYFDNDAIDRVGREDAKMLSSLLDNEGIVCTVHAPFMDLSPGGVDHTIRSITKDKLKKSIEMANILHAKGIVCHGGYNKWFYDGRAQVWLNASLDTWEDVLKEADKDLPVMIENIFEEEPSTLIELLGHFEGKGLYFCFDSGHFNLFSKVSVENWVMPLSKKIREMHLHDNRGASDDHMPIGMGTFPFRELKRLISRLDGILYTTEIHDQNYAAESIKRLKEFLS